MKNLPKTNKSKSTKGYLTEYRKKRKLYRSYSELALILESSRTQIYTLQQLVGFDNTEKAYVGNILANVNLFLLEIAGKKGKLMDEIMEIEKENNISTTSDNTIPDPVSSPAAASVVAVGKNL